MERVSGFASPSRDTNASTELVVPRSIPIEKRAGAITKDRSVLFRADLKLDLPSAIRVRVLHPEFECSKLCYDGVDAHRHDLPRWDIGKRRKFNFQQAGLLQFTFGIGKDLSRH